MARVGSMATATRAVLLPQIVHSPENSVCQKKLLEKAYSNP